ncbi:MAG: hypothetical protein ACI828_001602 [Flavobacteriales bacterium]|jgi:hypothetical protein
MPAHLNERELDKLKQLNQLEEHLFNSDEAVALLNDLGHVPLWIHLEVNRSTKEPTIIKLICSRRLRNDKDLNDLGDQFPPFHPVVPSPPWHKEGDKFNVNWKYQMLKIKWHALIWKWRYKKELKKPHHNTAQKKLDPFLYCTFSKIIENSYFTYTRLLSDIKMPL